MKICLIYPPANHMIRTNVPTAVDDVTGCYPPLGLLYVAGAVEQGGRHQVSVLDAVAEKLTLPQIRQKLEVLRPDVVGIQAITFTVVDAFQVAETVKALDPRIPVVLGGPHANLFPEETLRLKEVDFVLLGEGESNINAFLDALEAGKEMSAVPGIVYKSTAGEIVYGPPNPLIENLDTIPMPARHLLDHTLYSSVLGKSKYLTTIMSSRGCPARCIFCDRPHLGKAFRSRSAESVVSEMQACAEQFGLREFFFYDDTFTINRQRVLDVCRLLRERHLHVFWDIRARISTVDEEMLEQLYQAGCRRIHFGIESGNPEILRILKKGVDLDRAREVFRWCRRIGIETLAYFMIGSPGEGRKEIEDTIRYALSIDCDYVHAAVTTPFPGTELYRMGLEKGLYKTDFWAEFAAHPDPQFIPELWEENLSREELGQYMALLYRRFYGRPSYMVRRLMKVRSLRELKTKARAGIKLLANTLFR